MINDDLFYRQEIWATFPKQEEAIKYVKKFTNARIFSYQDHVNGQRRFLASTYKEFWKRCSFFSIVPHEISSPLITINHKPYMDMAVYVWIVYAGHFFCRYKQMNPKFRHHYEVIQEVVLWHNPWCSLKTNKYIFNLISLLVVFALQCQLCISVVSFVWKRL